MTPTAFGGSRAGRSTTLLALLSLLALMPRGDAWAASGSSVDVRANLREVRRPALTDTDAEVRQQLEAARVELDGLLDTPGATVADLAQGFGRVGQLYLVYRLAEIAEDCFQNAAQLAPDEFSWIYYLALVQQQAGRVEESVDSYRRALTIRPSAVPAKIRLARIDLAENRLDEAEALFHEVLETEPRSAAARHGLGQVAVLRRDYPNAVHHFEAVLAAQPEASTVQYQLGLAYREVGNLEKARTHIALQGRQEVRFPDPLLDELAPLAKGAGIRIVQATRARAAGDFEAAVRSFRLAIEADPDNSSSRISLASTLIQMGRTEDGIAELTELARREPQNFKAAYNLGTALAHRGDRLAAIEQLHRATQLDPSSGDAWFNLAELIANRGDFEEAGRYYDRALELAITEVDQVAIYQQLGAVLLSQGRLEAALPYFRSSAEIQSNSKDAHSQLAQLLGQMGRHAEAAQALETVIRLDPADVGPWFGRAVALLLAESYTQALRHLEQSQTALPGNVALLHVLARLLATCPDDTVRDQQRALGLAQRVVRAELKIEHAETVAMSLAGLDRFEDAAALQGQVLEQARRLGRTEVLPRLNTNLERYRAGKPVRAPWLQRGIERQIEDSR